MATTDQINDLITGYTDLKAFYEGERQELLNARNNLPNHLFVTRYVDEVNGQVGGDGSFASPFNEFDKAIDDMRKGQHMRIRLLSDAVWRKRSTPTLSHIHIAGAVDHSITPAQRTLQMLGAAENNTTHPAGAALRVGGLLFDNIDLKVNAGNTSQFSIEGFASAAFRSCDIDGSASTSTGALFSQFNGTLSIYMVNTTFNDMGGKWLKTAAAGTSLDVATTGALIDSEISNA